MCRCIAAVYETCAVACSGVIYKFAQTHIIIISHIIRSWHILMNSPK